MVYGIVVASDSFVFTKQGPIAIKNLQENDEILGVSGVSNFATFEKIHISLQSNINLKAATRLVTQATDSTLFDTSLIFSETVKTANEILSSKEVEFYNGKNLTLKGSATAQLNPEEAYVAGLLTTPIYKKAQCVAFLLRSMDDKAYQISLLRLIIRFSRNNGLQLNVEIKKGKIGYAWIILHGSHVDKFLRIISTVTPSNACLTLNMDSLKGFVAGMLDAHIADPVYGDDPVVTFSAKEVIQKRFLNSILMTLNSSIIETSCLTPYAPKLLETTTNLSDTIPVRNPKWVGANGRKRLALFSKIRGSGLIKTEPRAIIVDSQGFSPIIDCMYTYPCALNDI